MKNRSLTLIVVFFLTSIIILQSHSAGRATLDRDNTGAPGGQSGGNGVMITCQNCHENGNFEVGLNLELLDADNNLITEYIPNETYTAKVNIVTLSGDTPVGYGFQMVSLIDSDDSDVNGWIESDHSPNAQLTFANSTSRVYAEHDGMSTTNEFTAKWKAPESNSGDLSFYIAGIGTNGNGGSSGDHAAVPIKVTFPESSATSTSQVSNIDISIYPNPTSYGLNINGEIKNKTIEVYQSGKLVLSKISESQNIQLPIGDLVAGIYFVVVKNEDNQIIATKKAIKN